MQFPLLYYSEDSLTHVPVSRTINYNIQVLRNSKLSLLSTGGISYWEISACDLCVAPGEDSWHIPYFPQQSTWVKYHCYQLGWSQTSMVTFLVLDHLYIRWFLGCPWIKFLGWTVSVHMSLFAAFKAASFISMFLVLCSFCLSEGVHIHGGTIGIWTSRGVMGVLLVGVWSVWSGVLRWKQFYPVRSWPFAFSKDQVFSFHPFGFRLSGS